MSEELKQITFEEWDKKVNPFSGITNRQLFELARQGMEPIRRQETKLLTCLSEVTHTTIEDYAKRNHDLENEVAAADHAIKEQQEIINIYRQEAKPLTEHEILKMYGESESLEKFIKLIHAALPPDQRARIAELETFLKGDIREALIDLQNYIENSKWTRGKQAELDNCKLLIEKIDK